MAPLAYTPRQVAEALQVSHQTVYRMIADGLIRTVPWVRPMRIAAGELDRLLNEQVSA